jgi:hypothetical protein
MLRRLALVRTEVSEQRIASIMRVTRIDQSPLSLTLALFTINILRPSPPKLWNLAISSKTQTTPCYSYLSLHPHSSIPYLRFPSHTVFLRSVLRILVTANFILSTPILVTLMMEELGSSETFVLTRITRRSIQETAFFIFTAAETSNLTKQIQFPARSCSSYLAVFLL